MNPWIVLTVCATVVFVALIWAAVILAAADRAAKAMQVPSCNCSGRTYPFDMRTEKKEED